MARAMKDSGISWAGEIPAQWQVVRLKECFIENNRRQPNKIVLSLSYGRIIEKDFSAKKGVTPESFDSYQGVHPGDVVLRLTDLQNDQKSLRVGYADIHGIITSAYLCVRGRGLHPKFSAYLLHDIGDIQKVFYGLGGGVRQSMKFADLAEILVPQLSRDEQRRIAAWLDIQTSRIDRHLDLLERKRELLSKLRLAVVRDAVTAKVLWDADTGQANQLPQGWEMVRIKDIAKLKSGDFISAEKIEASGAFPVFGGNGLRGFGVTYNCEGEFALIGRQGALCGNVNFANGKFWATEHAVVVRPKRKLATPWLGEMLRCMNLNQYATASAQPGLSVENIVNKFLPLPTLTDQQNVVDRLNRELPPIDKQIALIDQLEALLKEQRKAIIHEAVTGKIDLSAFEPPQPQEALAA